MSLNVECDSALVETGLKEDSVVSELGKEEVTHYHSLSPVGPFHIPLLIIYIIRNSIITCTLDEHNVSANKICGSRIEQEWGIIEVFKKLKHSILEHNLPRPTVQGENARSGSGASDA